MIKMTTTTTTIATVCAAGMVSVPIAAFIGGDLKGWMALVICLVSAMSALSISFYTIHSLHRNTSVDKSKHNALSIPILVSIILGLLLLLILGTAWLITQGILVISIGVDKV